jgi:hypothetical protein
MDFDKMNIDTKEKPKTVTYTHVLLEASRQLHGLVSLLLMKSNDNTGKHQQMTISVTGKVLHPPISGPYGNFVYCTGGHRCASVIFYFAAQTFYKKLTFLPWLRYMSAFLGTKKLHMAKWSLVLEKVGSQDEDAEFEKAGATLEEAAKCIEQHGYKVKRLDLLEYYPFAPYKLISNIHFSLTGGHGTSN